MVLNYSKYIHFTHTESKYSTLIPKKINIWSYLKVVYIYILTI